jgi:hypothetical protein
MTIAVVAAGTGSRQQAGARAAVDEVRTKLRISRAGALIQIDAGVLCLLVRCNLTTSGRTCAHVCCESWGSDSVCSMLRPVDAV